MYNNYFGQYPSYQNYGQYPQYQPVQQRPQMQPMVQQQNEPQPKMPFSEVRYGARAEAEARVVYPTESIMYIDKNLGEIYIKSANQMGEPTFEEFTFKRKETQPLAEVPKIDAKNFLTKEDVKDFLKKDDLKTIDEKLDFLEKQVKLNQTLKGENVNGQQTNTIS